MRNVNADSVVWCASYWWTDCDPCGSVVATTAKRCEREALRAMRSEARSAFEDGTYDKLYQAQDAIHWSGEFPFALRDLCSNERELADAIDDLNNNGVWYGREV